MNYNLETYFLLFMTYSILGWVMESIKMIWNKNVGHFVNRGFLIGPYLPIYGTGVVAITFLLGKYANDIPALFCLSMITCGVLEYFTSFFMEKFFNARWWDYSNRKFNINGRICLETIIPFGIAGTIIICFLNPLLISLFNLIPELIKHIISISLLIIIAVDTIVTCTIVAGLKNTVDILSEPDDTENVSAYVRDKAEDMAMQLESDVKKNSRKRSIKRRRKVLHMKLRTTKHLKEMKKKSDEINKKITTEITQKLELAKEKSMLSREKSILTKEEVTAKIKAKFSEKSILHRRLMNAFPTFEVTEKIKNKFNNKK